MGAAPGASTPSPPERAQQGSVHSAFIAHLLFGRSGCSILRAVLLQSIPSPCGCCRAPGNLSCRAARAQGTARGRGGGPGAGVWGSARCCGTDRLSRVFQAHPWEGREHRCILRVAAPGSGWGTRDTSARVLGVLAGAQGSPRKEGTLGSPRCKPQGSKLGMENPAEGDEEGTRNLPDLIRAFKECPGGGREREIPV